ncbi:MAG: response regulator [Agriterribacter sp.]
MGRRIIIIDDEPEILEVVRMILEYEKFIVFPFRHAGNIFNDIVELKPDLILLDVKLGNEDGRKICAELKYNEKTKHLPVILFSASSMLKEDIIRWGADDFINKPFDMNNLVKTVDAHLK